MRTLELTANEVANLPTEGTFWIVREGERDVKAEAMNHALAVELFARPDLRWPESSPPAVFTQACAPCETCGDARRRTVRDLSGVETFGVPCPECRIELVGPCPTCGGTDGQCGGCYGLGATFTIGYAYAVGQPHLIIGKQDGALRVPEELIARLAEGDKIGCYALELRRG